MAWYIHQTYLFIIVQESQGHQGFSLGRRVFLRQIQRSLDLYYLNWVEVYWLNFFIYHFSFSIIGGTAYMYFLYTVPVQFYSTNPYMPIRICYNFAILLHYRYPLNCVCGIAAPNHLIIAFKSLTILAIIILYPNTTSVLVLSYTLLQSITPAILIPSYFDPQLVRNYITWVYLCLNMFMAVSQFSFFRVIEEVQSDFWVQFRSSCQVMLMDILFFSYQRVQSWYSMNRMNQKCSYIFIKYIDLLDYRYLLRYKY